MGAGSFRQSINNQQGKEMSTDIVKASVTPPPTKHELRVAAARVISQERKQRNEKRKEAIKKADDALRKAVIKAGLKALRKAKPHASSGWSRSSRSTEWNLSARVDVKIEGEPLLSLHKALQDLENTTPEETDENVIVRQLREREAGIVSTPKNLRVEAIIATPALRKAVKEFGEKLLATPTQSEKQGAIEVAAE